jgi:hypothetical protein
MYLLFKETRWTRCTWPGILLALNFSRVPFDTRAESLGSDVGLLVVVKVCLLVDGTEIIEFISSVLDIFIITIV